MDDPSNQNLVTWRIGELERRMLTIETWKGIKDIEIALLNQTITKRAQIWGAAASFATSALFMLIQWWLKY